MDGFLISCNASYDCNGTNNHWVPAYQKKQMGDQTFENALQEQRRIATRLLSNLRRESISIDPDLGPDEKAEHQSLEDQIQKKLCFTSFDLVLRGMTKVYQNTFYDVCLYTQEFGRLRMALICWKVYICESLCFPDFLSAVFYCVYHPLHLL